MPKNQSAENYLYTLESIKNSLDKTIFEMEKNFKREAICGF